MKLGNILLIEDSLYILSRIGTNCCLINLYNGKPLQNKNKSESFTYDIDMSGDIDIKSLLKFLGKASPDVIYPCLFDYVKKLKSVVNCDSNMDFVDKIINTFVHILMEERSFSRVFQGYHYEDGILSLDYTFDSDNDPDEFPRILQSLGYGHQDSALIDEGEHLFCIDITFGDVITFLNSLTKV
jgi:hypothetical protein